MRYSLISLPIYKWPSEQRDEKYKGPAWHHNCAAAFLDVEVEYSWCPVITGTTYLKRRYSRDKVEKAFATSVPRIVCAKDQYVFLAMHSMRIGVRQEDNGEYLNAIREIASCAQDTVRARGVGCSSASLVLPPFGLENINFVEAVKHLKDRKGHHW